MVYEDVVVEDEGHHGSSRGGASSGRAGHPEPSGIHVMATSNGSPYQNWQTRIMYRTFLDAAKNSDMKHFTRLLHRRTDDELMAEVPTVRRVGFTACVECDTWCEFPVADRPDAIKKWLATPDSRRGEWILMIEMDYVWKKAVPMPEPGSPAVAFHFNYINPNYPRLPEVMRSLMPPEKRDEIKMEDRPCTGPAPTMIRRVDLVPLMDEYERIAAAIEADPVAKQRLGWVREMYAYDLAGGDHRGQTRGAGPGGDDHDRAASRGRQDGQGFDVPLHLGGGVFHEERGKGLVVGQEALRRDQTRATAGQVQTRVAPRGRLRGGV